MYFETVKSTALAPRNNKRLKILAQIALSGFMIVGCIAAFHHLNSDMTSGSAHAATVDASSPEAYQASHLRKSRLQIRSLAKNIYKKPNAIKGKEISSLAQIFYQPELTRIEGDIVMWQYRNEECVMDLYFEKGERPSGKEKVRHFETRFRDPQINNDDAGVCVHSLLKTSGAPRMVDVSAIFKL